MVSARVFLVYKFYFSERFDKAIFPLSFVGYRMTIPKSSHWLFLILYPTRAYGTIAKLIDLSSVPTKNGVRLK